jgi:hypothetical protein
MIHLINFLPKSCFTNDVSLSLVIYYFEKCVTHYLKINFWSKDLVSVALLKFYFIFKGEGGGGVWKTN